MTIKHLVLSGGLYYGLCELGALQYLKSKKFIKKRNIKTIHSSSVGVLVSILLCLKIKLKKIIKMFNNVPWGDLINFNHESLFNCFSQKGILGKEIFIKIIKKIFRKNNISMNITLKELYEYSNIEIHCFCLNINKFKVVDFNYLTFPNINIIQLIYQCCAFPTLFKPTKYNNEFYMDAGILNNYPVDICLQKYDKNEILGIIILPKKYPIINEETNLIQLYIYLFRNLSDICNNVTEKNCKLNLIPNEIKFYLKSTSFTDILKICKSKRKRKKLINIGKKVAKEFLHDRI